MSHGSQKAVIAALSANLGIAVAKFVGYFFTGAASLLAEAIHSCADSGNQALLLLGARKAARAPSEVHPFGYARERYFWAFVVALVIFILGAVFAIYEGVHKLFHPEPLSHPLIGVGILFVSVALEGWSFRTALGEAKATRGNQSWRRFFGTTKEAELPVVLLEDLGALVGLVLALLGLGLAWVTGEPRFDSLGSIVIGLLLGAIAYVLALRMKSLLIGESATIEEVQQIKEALLDSPDILSVIHLRTQHFGPFDLLVGAKIELPRTHALPEIAAAIDAAEQRIRAKVPSAKMIYLEPDLFRSALVTPEPETFG